MHCTAAFSRDRIPDFSAIGYLHGDNLSPIALHDETAELHEAREASGVVLASATGAGTAALALEEGVFAKGIESGAPALRVGGYAAGRAHGAPVAVDATVRVPMGAREVPVDDVVRFAVGYEGIVQLSQVG